MLSRSLSLNKITLSGILSRTTGGLRLGRKSLAHAIIGRQNIAADIRIRNGGETACLEMSNRATEGV